MQGRGRKPGTLVRCTCRVCSKVELARGCGGNFRCAGCLDAGLQIPGKTNTRWLGHGRAQAIVAGLIRTKRLADPRTLNCADCSGRAAEYEHRDYNQPSIVVPICRSCNLKRGPGIPLIGTIETLVASGFPPYRQRKSVEKLFLNAGLCFPRLLEMPTKLGLSEWLEIIPVWTKHQLLMTTSKS